MDLVEISSFLLPEMDLVERSCLWYVWIGFGLN
jgi:hypothetical protein